MYAWMDGCEYMCVFATVAVFGNPVVYPGLAVAAIVLLLCGVGGIAFCESIATYVFHRNYTAFNDEGRDGLTDGVDDDDNKKGGELV